jgi:hypothetical protein
MRLDEYVTEDSFMVKDKTLPAGSFVKLIHPVYLPDHLKKSNENNWMDKTKETWVYCHYGIILMPLRLIRKVT